MKKIGLQILLSLAIIFTFSCKREVSPELLITVVDTLNRPAERAWVETTIDGSVLGVVNPAVVDSGLTDQFGKIVFEYKNTVLVDVAVYRTRTSTIKIDSLSVLVETKRKGRGSDNVVERTLVLK